MVSSSTKVPPTKVAATKWLLIILTIGLLGLYIQYYASFSKTFQIIQASLDHISIDTLQERQPIIIQDRLVDPSSLTSTLFKWTWAFKQTEHVKGSPYITIVHNKYTILFNSVRDILVNIIPADNKKLATPFQKGGSAVRKYRRSLHSINDSNVVYVTIKLKKQQCIVLPAHWMYHTVDDHNAIYLNDPLSLLVLIYQSTSST